MQDGNRTALEDASDSLCPDLTINWELDDRINSIDRVILKAKLGNRRYQFEAVKGYALKHFTGQYTGRQVLNRCRSRFGTFLPADFIPQLLQELVDLEILSASSIEIPENPISEVSSVKSPNLIQLKSSVQWISHPKGYWILRNPEDITCLQIDNFDKEVISQLGKQPIVAIVNQFDISLEDLQYLLRILTAAGMLEGTQAQKAANKFSLKQLLYCKIPLINPDAWIAQQIDKVRWIWTWQFSYALCVFITASISIWLAFASDLSVTSRQVWASGNTTLLTLGLLTMFVVSLHELGHAFTLKHYGGIVPEIGLLFMCLIPGCYTNTTDQYALVRRRQRTLVVVAGLLVQVTLWAIAVWIWLLSTSIPGLHRASFLLMTAALLTVALNLNPLNRFDGYYLLVALTGINNLRERSFQFYTQLIQREESLEEPRDRWILAAYAPLSIIYTVVVLGYLLSLAWNWLLLNVPATINFPQFIIPH